MRTSVSTRIRSLLGAACAAAGSVRSALAVGTSSLDLAVAVLSGRVAGALLLALVPAVGRAA
ncbi:hypothetical protein D3C84_1190450 [compost metagenome]